MWLEGDFEPKTISYEMNLYRSCGFVGNQHLSSTERQSNVHDCIEQKIERVCGLC